MRGLRETMQWQGGRRGGGRGRTPSWRALGALLLLLLLGGVEGDSDFQTHIAICHARPYGNALFTCKSMGMQLAGADGAAGTEATTVAAFKACFSPHWRPGSPLRLWVDAFKDPGSGSWATSEGAGIPNAPWVDAPWADATGAAETEHACAVQRADNEWEPADCEELNPFICVHPEPLSNDPRQSQRAWIPCGARKAAAARSECERLGLEPAVIRTQRDLWLATQTMTSVCAPLSGAAKLLALPESDFSELESTRYLPVWVDGMWNDDGLNGPGWYLTNGDPLPYTAWAATEPNLGPGNVNQCITLRYANDMLGRSVGDLPKMYATDCEEITVQAMCFLPPPVRENLRAVEVSTAQDLYRELTIPGLMMLTVRISSTLFNLLDVEAIPIYGIRMLEGINRLGSLAFRHEPEAAELPVFWLEPYAELKLSNVRIETKDFLMVNNIGRNYWTQLEISKCVFLDPVCTVGSNNKGLDLAESSSLVASLQVVANEIGIDITNIGTFEEFVFSQESILADPAGILGIGDFSTTGNAISCSFEGPDDPMDPSTADLDTSECQSMRDFGHSYTGTYARTIGGYPCLPWSRSDGTEGRIAFKPNLLESNYCRNPTSSTGGVWCYVDSPAATTSGPLWDYCGAPHCRAENETPIPTPNASPGPNGGADGNVPSTGDEGGSGGGGSSLSTQGIIGIVASVVGGLGLCAIVGVTVLLSRQCMRRQRNQLTARQLLPTKGAPVAAEKSVDMTTLEQTLEIEHGTDTNPLTCLTSIESQSDARGKESTSLLQECVLLHPLGRGTFGSVWLSKWRGAEVAVKIISTSLSQLLEKNQKDDALQVSDDIISLIESKATELFIGTKLQHPNIVRVFTHEIVLTVLRSALAPPAGGSNIIGESAMSMSQPSTLGSQNSNAASTDAVVTKLRISDFKKYNVDISPRTIRAVDMVLVMEVCDLGDLNSNLRKVPLVAYNRQINTCSINMLAMMSMLQQVACAMMHLHSEGVVHADLKPANVLLQSNNTQALGLVAKVADFGLSVVIGPEDTHQSTHRGTYRYMAPEVLLNNRLGRAADVWSFGAIMFEALCFTTPFKKTTVEICEMYRQGEFPYSNLPSSLPKWCSDIITNCTRVDPEARPTFSEIYNTITVRLNTNTLLLP